MTTDTLVIIGAVILVAVAALMWMYFARQRRAHLRTRFGPEYERTVHDIGDARRAEAALLDREKRVASYHIRELKAEERTRFTDAWRRVQNQFVDAPAAAVTEADLLVTEVMTTRGYPMADWDRRVEDLTVDHPDVVHHYREAKAIVDRNARKAASTEDLRQALVHYRALFADLLDVRPVRRSA